jgi:GNAT superfamily N-acetyltransferase
MPGAFEIHELGPSALEPWIDALGILRIRVFREFPYLYDGSLDYERSYLRIYQQAEHSRVFLVTDAAATVVGATTCLPLAAEGEEFKAPFLLEGMAVEDIFYFGESLLLPEWRGRGLGKEFFNRREAHARRLGFKTTAFCAVDRPENHPARPPDHRPLDDFWKSRGYVKQPRLRAEFNWKELGEATESPKSLTFWTRSWV